MLESANDSAKLIDPTGGTARILGNRSKMDLVYWDDKANSQLKQRKEGEFSVEAKSLRFQIYVVNCSRQHLVKEPLINEP